VVTLQADGRRNDHLPREVRGIVFRGDGIPSRVTDIRRDAVLSSRAVGTERAIARTAGRALDLLLLLVARGQNGLTARELAKLLDAPRTSVSDLLTVLEERGFVAPTAEGHGWRLDFRVAQLGNAYLHEFSVREVGRTAMRELSRRTGLTTQMAVLDQTDIVYIERQDASRQRSEPQVVTDIGSRRPAYCTSLGKAMLAFLSDNELERLYGPPGRLMPRTKATITTLGRLRSELAAIRRRGYAVDQEETTEGIVCIGSAILGADGRPEAAISLAGLSAGLPATTIENLGRTVARAASQVSVARGGARAIPRLARPKTRRGAAARPARRVRGAA
jgi:IclR family acetate operon transcriptional repressor